MASGGKQFAETGHDAYGILEMFQHLVHADHLKSLWHIEELGSPLDGGETLRLQGAKGRLGKVVRVDILRGPLDPRQLSDEDPGAGAHIKNLAVGTGQLQDRLGLRSLHNGAGPTNRTPQFVKLEWDVLGGIDSLEGVRRRLREHVEHLAVPGSTDLKLVGTRQVLEIVTTSHHREGRAWVAEARADWLRVDQGFSGEKTL